MENLTKLCGASATYGKRKQSKMMREIQTRMIAWANDILENNNTVFVGIATTGVEPNFDEVVEMTILDAAGTTLFNEQFLPVKAMPKSVSKINGIWQRDLVGKRPIATYWKEIAGLLSGKIAVVYNAEFVNAMLRNTALRHHLPKFGWYTKPVWEDAMLAYGNYNFTFRKPALTSLVELPKQRNSADTAKAILDLVTKLAGGRPGVKPKVAAAKTVEPKTIRKINRQIAKGQPITIKYSLFDVVKKAMDKVIVPCGLISMAEGFYLVGYEQARGILTPKSFRLDHLPLAA